MVVVAHCKRTHPPFHFLWNLRNRLLEQAENFARLILRLPRRSTLLRHWHKCQRNACARTRALSTWRTLFDTDDDVDADGIPVTLFSALFVLVTQKLAPVLVPRAIPSASTNCSTASSAIDQGFVATHQGLHSVLTDLLSTVKGLRQEQVQQAEHTSVLEETVAQQTKTIQSLVVALQDKHYPMSKATTSD